jgi:hypothetical protein
VAEGAGDAAAEGVRAIPHSPVGAAFGAAQRLASGSHAAARSAARGRLERSVRRQRPALFVDGTLFETGVRKSERALVVGGHVGPRDPVGVGAGDTPDDPDVGRDWHPRQKPRGRK